MTLDELVKDIDVEEVRSQNRTEERVLSLFTDVEKGKDVLHKAWKIACYGGLVVAGMVAIVFILKLLFPQWDFLWATN